MSKPTITIHDSQSGEVTTREMNNSEIAQWTIDQADATAAKQSRETKQAARISALGKLEALGLSADEIASL
jgi:hypothetical protein